MYCSRLLFFYKSYLYTENKYLHIVSSKSVNIALFTFSKRNCALKLQYIWSYFNQCSQFSADSLLGSPSTVVGWDEIISFFANLERIIALVSSFREENMISYFVFSILIDQVLCPVTIVFSDIPVTIFFFSNLSLHLGMYIKSWIIVP